MTVPRKAMLLAAISVLANATLGLWVFTLHPDKERLLFLALFPAALWVFVEAAQPGDKARLGSVMIFHRSVIASAGMLLGVKAAVRLAFAYGLLQADGVPTAQRCMGILTSILLMLWGNYLPKVLSPWEHREQPFDWQRVHRAVGWLAMLSGGVAVTAWLVLPIPAARVAMAAAFVAFTVLAVGIKFLSLATYPSRRAPASR